MVTCAFTHRLQRRGRGLLCGASHRGTSTNARGAKTESEMKLQASWTTTTHQQTEQEHDPGLFVTEKCFFGLTCSTGDLLRGDRRGRLPTHRDRCALPSAPQHPRPSVCTPPSAWPQRAPACPLQPRRPPLPLPTHPERTRRITSPLPSLTLSMNSPRASGWIPPWETIYRQTRIHRESLLEGDYSLPKGLAQGIFREWVSGSILMQEVC